MNYKGRPLILGQPERGTWTNTFKVSSGHRAALTWLICGILSFSATLAVHAQAYGPPAIAYQGSLYTISNPSNDGNPDGYVGPNGNGVIYVDYAYAVHINGDYPTYWYDPQNQVFNAISGYDAHYSPIYAPTTDILAVGSDNVTVLGLTPAVTVHTNYGLTSGLWDGTSEHQPDNSFTNASGTYIGIFMNLPNQTVFQIDSSPVYLYTGGNSLIDESSGTWPPSNILANPPQTVYVLDSGDSASPAYSLQGVQVSFGQNWYTEQDNYYSSSNLQLTIQRYYTNGSYSGSVTGESDYNNSFSGSYDPVAMQFSNVSPSSIQVSLSSMSGNGRNNGSCTNNNGGNNGSCTNNGNNGSCTNNGINGNNPPPRQGPLYISWNGVLLNYSYTDTTGNDYYADSTNQATVTISTGYWMSGYLPLFGPISGYYNTSSDTFYNYQNITNFFALDNNGNPIGLPTGLNLLFGFSGIGNSIYISNNQQTYQLSANYTYQRPDGSWGVKYVGVPANYWFLVADASGNFDSQIYVTTDTSSQDLVINAISGWPVSSAYPAQLYVNGVGCTLQWNSNNIGGPGYTYGGVSYSSNDGSTNLSLNWNWNNGVSWYWSMSSGQWNGDSGGWDGVSTFSNLPVGLVISLNPAINTPVEGPSSIAWNGTPLTFNAAASGASNTDLYQGSVNGTPIQLTIDSNGNVAVYLGGSSSPTFTGTYNPVSQLFNFGSANVGTVAAVANSNNILGTTSSTGNLDIPGNILSLGSWQNSSGESVSGFSLAFTPPPNSGQTAVLQFASNLALTDWLWSHSDTDGSASQIKAMELDPNNKLLLYSPSSAPSATIALDPANGASFQVPVRYIPAGDLSMGNFQTGPQPNQ